MSQTRPTGRDLIAAERARQINAEGYLPEHDHGRAPSLLRAAEAYERGSMATWPWDARTWKPKDLLRNLIRAGALYQAAMDAMPAHLRPHPTAAAVGVTRCAAAIDRLLASAADVLTLHAVEPDGAVHLGNAKETARYSESAVQSPDARSVPYLLDGILHALIAIAERLPAGAGR